jgi:hypothetical protein
MNPFLNFLEGHSNFFSAGRSLWFLVAKSFSEKLKLLSPGYTMENLPPHVETWVVKRTQERHYLCRLCGKQDEDHGNADEFQQHLSSWPHRIIVRNMEALYCTPCGMQCRYPSVYKIHLKSNAHKQKENPQPKVDLRCEVCNVNFRGRTEIERHLLTKKHAKHAKTDPVVSSQ